MFQEGDIGSEDTLSGESNNSKRSKREGEYKSLEKIRLPPLYHRDGTPFTPVGTQQRQNYIEVLTYSFQLFKYQFPNFFFKYPNIDFPFAFFLSSHN